MMGDKECPSDRLVNEAIVYLVVITLLLVSHWMTVTLSDYRWFQQIFFRIPGNHFGPMQSFSMGLYFGIVFVHANQMIPFQKLPPFKEIIALVVY